MRWRDRKGSENVEDRRDETGGGGFPFPIPGGGGRIPIPMGSGGLGFWGVLIVIGLMLLFGIDPRTILQGPDGESPSPRTEQPFPRRESPGPSPRTEAPGRPVPGQREAQTEVDPSATAGNDEQKQFVSVVLQTTEEVWREKFRQSGRTYRDPKLVLYRDRISSRCGFGAAQMGPFYCPLDGKVYVDLSFYEELKRRFRAPGDFAQAYVIAHEVGHHVQTLLGITERVMQAKARAGEGASNAIQVRMELQADCLAGIWAYHTKNRMQIVDEGDIDEALTAAAAIGDDRIQRRTQGEANPETFTHGSSEQRVRWFKRGFESGNFPSCDTFSTDDL
jgi:uncharacterized protein